ncbi:6200_t:CDS:2, partial [Scutellospora calospora]
MSNDDALCSLCNKMLKNLHGLHIHQKAIYQTNTNSDCFSCPYYSRTYKTKGGLCRHETLKHYDYNISSDFFKLSQNHINETKETLVYLIRSRLMLHSNHSGLQTASSPMTESEFVCIFQDHIQRYSICQQKYICQVILVSNSTRSMNNIKSLRSSLQVNSENLEIIIIWEKKINDEEGNISITGWITLKFL